MIGGMVGNNSSGSTSIKYGVTRDKVLELHTILSDGSKAIFNEKSKQAYEDNCKSNGLEGQIYSTIRNELSSEKIKRGILDAFPKAEIHRRNTGYAVDELIKTQPFSESDKHFNMCKLLSGSEGTLAFTTQITLKLDKIPPSESVLVVAHFNSINNCLKLVENVMKHDLYSCEMLDKTILDLTKHNKKQLANRQFIKGDPKAILMCEIRANSIEEAQLKGSALKDTIASSNLAYDSVILLNDAIDRAIELRKAGLGLLGNMIGDKKAVACIEDTAVPLSDLANYIEEFTQVMKTFNQEAIYYAHAGAGELHLRPILNLKTSKGVQDFKAITTTVAQLVKKYKGSFSGEHGDGLVRSEFIPMMIGDSNYEILKKIKTVFDPNNIFNPGKIVDAYPMDTNLRYDSDCEAPEIQTLLDFSDAQGILREAEKCNGSGDCRKLPEFGGTMCPSYRATLDEKDTTRARANALREFLTHSEKKNKFNHIELKEVFDLCLSCKACASECPSSVDVASLKAEFQYQYQKENGYEFKDKFFANATKYNRMASRFPQISNFLLQNRFTSKIIKSFLSIHEDRSLPIVSNVFENILKSENQKETLVPQPIKSVYLFVDEFSKYLDVKVIEDAKVLLNKLNYNVLLLSNLDSGRSYISKGFLEEAKVLANKNIDALNGKISGDTPLIGLEPSAILSFKDEYTKLVDDKNAAKTVAKHTYLIEEFLKNEADKGHIRTDQFTTSRQTIKFHGHCHQKALANQESSFSILNFPINYKVTIIPSGCCGMAGSFGYEKEHYDLSMKIGEQTLFPAVRNSKKEDIIAANGTSCRHQIKDGTNRIALHPVTILKNALL
jgi:Fe-S oxidoreductase/FAD/FMN-containing dehydrogenase